MNKRLMETDFFFKFIYLLRGGEGKRKSERIPSRPHVISTESDMRLDLTNCEIMTLVEIKTWAVN